jgi:hypothetical protein
VDAWTILAVIAAFVVLVLCAPAAFVRGWSWRARIAAWRTRREP